ncbi:hypothetical protein DPM19_04020 [Actinomadura craniellae]|uniref:Uncharacterized protein n=1 Tax=Actinomadura craniellae TaxID=2231787 RepID=A0A365HAZ9_9ACTN|nr:hypothetical protein [Actinomadura craniellae]RAY16106.1 hypothetical protein DPM19_04020 [Actinomadura craniellae]
MSRGYGRDLALALAVIIVLAHLLLLLSLAAWEDPEPPAPDPTGVPVQEISRTGQDGAQNAKPFQVSLIPAVCRFTVRAAVPPEL